MGKKEDFTTSAQIGLASTVGVLLVSATAIGYFFGSWLDSKFHTDPWMMVVFTGLGVVSGFYEIARIVIRLSK